jgi:3-phenylpropionate/trans-cinnamate dioxygenase ferredoxin reductase component
MSNENQTALIIGAGECGARAAFALRENGHAGRIVLIGTEALHPYERPPLSKHALAADAEPTHVVPRERFEEHGIELLTGVSAIAIDPKAKAVELSSGTTIPFDVALIATGASPRRLPFVAKDSKRILTLRTYEDALEIRKVLGEDRHIAIIGGGFIGLELAASARKAGTRVTLVEGLPRVLSRGVPAAIAERIASRHVAEGVDLRCGVSISGIDETADKATIELADGGKIAADLVIVGIGAAPNVALAEAAGLVVENGIAVNDRLETSAPGIFAAGDCCSFPLAIYGGRRVRLEAWRNAQDQGSLAARNMLGHDEPISAVPWFWSDQYDLTLQVAGLAEGATTHVTRPISDDALLQFHLAEDGRLLAASGIATGNAIARDVRIAEMLIAKGARPDPAALADPDVKMKSLLAQM